MPYHVMVDDNFHHGDVTERCHAGVFETVEAAEARCRQIVDEYLDAAEKIEGRASATRLWESYKMFGDDPFIVASDAPAAFFSAWTYALECCESRCGHRVAAPRWSRYDPESDDYDPLA